MATVIRKLISILPGCLAVWMAPMVPLSGAGSVFSVFPLPMEVVGVFMYKMPKEGNWMRWHFFKLHCTCFPISTALFLSSMFTILSPHFSFFYLVPPFFPPQFLSLSAVSLWLCGDGALWLAVGGCAVGALEESICDRVVVVWSDGVDRPAAATL